MVPAAAAPLCMECSQSRRAARLGAEIEHCRPYRGQPLVGVLLLGQQFQNDDGHEGDREDGRACLEDRAHLRLQSTTQGMSAMKAAVGELLGAASGERPLAQSTH